MEADQLGRLRDVLEAARLIGTYVRDVNEADFRADTQKQDAVIRRIEIIGEAAAHLSPAARQEIPEFKRRRSRSRGLDRGRSVDSHLVSDYPDVKLTKALLQRGFELLEEALDSG